MVMITHKKRIHWISLILFSTYTTRYFKMRKTSARNGEETKKVFSYPSHGGYVTSDD